MKMLHTANNRRCKAFTLVEIMVALAMLMVIMSFLFEFVLSSQRIWRASESKVKSFDTAQLVLEVVGDEVRNMRFSNEADAYLPYFRINKQSKVTINDDTDQTLSYFFLISQYKSGSKGARDNIKNIGLYPVVYIYAKEARKLYRVALDRENACGNTIRNPMVFYGVDFRNASNDSATDTYINTYLTSILTKVTNAVADENLIAENVSRFDIVPSVKNSSTFRDVNLSAAGGTAPDKAEIAIANPKTLRIVMDILDWNEARQEEYYQAASADKEKLIKNNSRGFAKTIYL